MYTCHRYGGEPTQAAIQTIINFRDSVNLPMYMGEIGHNTDEWQAAFCQTMRENNIGYTFWPYKKMDGSSFVGITPPENWANIVYFSEAPRATYKEIREARPAQGDDGLHRGMQTEELCGSGGLYPVIGNEVAGAASLQTVRIKSQRMRCRDLV